MLYHTLRRIVSHASYLPSSSYGKGPGMVVPEHPVGKIFGLTKKSNALRVARRFN